MFEDAVIRQVITVARAHGIDPAGLLAVVEVESAGKSLEIADGKTPTFLFERHIFYSQLKNRAPSRLQFAVSQGLAIPKWDKAHQYSDQNTSAKRLALLSRARAVDWECADRSCSWGVGQIMGFHYDDLQFGSARDMVTFMRDGGIPAQVEVMVRWLEHSGLIRALDQHQWATFAKGYNGAGYKANRYDTKLEAAYKVWKNKLASMPSEPVKPIPIPVPSPIPVQPQKPAAPPPSSVQPPKPTPAPAPSGWQTFWQRLSGLWTTRRMP